jgi:hypothetical protein
MAEKKIKTRVQSKHDKEVNWNNATGFIPLAGEIIIYDPDDKHNVPRFKVGNGILQADGTVEGTPVTELPFADANLISTIQAEFDNKISSGTADPSASTIGQYYFKYTE